MSSFKISLSAVEAFERGMGAWGVKTDRRRTGITLQDLMLIEDDGPGIGSNCEYLKTGRSPVFEIAGDHCVKKILYVKRAHASAARLCVPPGTNVQINGTRLRNPIDVDDPVIEPKLLKEGDNEIVLSARDSAHAVIKIAPRRDILQSSPDRKDRPIRSFTSSDGGRTWQPIDGELMIRLHLTQFGEEGCFTSAVIDTNSVDGGSFAYSQVTLRRLSLSHVAEIPARTGVEFAVRTGSTPVYESDCWTDWQPFPLSTSKRHRYFQWKAIFSSRDPLATPALKRVTFSATLARKPAPQWADRVRVLDSHNEEIRYTSIPFEYENPEHPKLVQLRRKYKLDDVVKEGKTEFEKIVRLRNWVAHQWKWTPPVDYPPFDADKIIQSQLGFCVHFAVAFIQCAASLGYQARFVFGNHPGTTGGHEVTEIWSNDYHKWIVMDPSSTDNRHYIDPRTQEPLSMLEVHERMLRAYYGLKPVTNKNRPNAAKNSTEIAMCHGLEMLPTAGKSPRDEKPAQWPPWTLWLHLRYIPRNNFFDRPETLPRFQGWNWDWTGYWIWRDEQTPMEWHYRNFTGRRSDLDWSINQVRFDAACDTEPGTIDIQMGTVTPNFDTFLVAFNGDEWKKKPRAFTWKLQPGTNRLEMCTRNTAGVHGPVSHLEVRYEPKTK
jgi:hypothetical protein